MTHSQIFLVIRMQRAQLRAARESQARLIQERRRAAAQDRAA